MVWGVFSVDNSLKVARQLTYFTLLSEEDGGALSCAGRLFGFKDISRRTSSQSRLDASKGHLSIGVSRHYGRGARTNRRDSQQQ